LVDPLGGRTCTIRFASQERAFYSDHEWHDEPIDLSMDHLSALTLDVLGRYIAKQDETACPRALLELIGTHLYEFLFPKGEGAQRLRDRFETLCTSGARFCVQLEFGQDAWPLAQLPWEFLYIPDRDLFVAAPTRNQLILTRHVPNQGSLVGATDKVKVLVAVSDPESNRAAIRTGDLEQLLGRLADEYKDSFAYKVATNLDWDALVREIEAEEPTVFHFLGHGERGALWFVGAADKVAEVKQSRRPFSKDVIDAGVLTSADAVQQMFRSHTPDLVVLEACEGDYDSELLPGVAQLLVEVVPAVVAMRYKITQDASSRFVAVLYERIADGGYLDDAVLEARRELASLRVTELGQRYNDRAFVTPVLYMKGSAAVCRRLPKHDEATSQTNINQPRPDGKTCPGCAMGAWTERGWCENCGLRFDCPKCETHLNTPHIARWCGNCGAELAAAESPPGAELGPPIKPTRRPVVNLSGRLTRERIPPDRGSNTGVPGG
jgi:CHAT domain